MHFLTVSVVLELMGTFLTRKYPLGEPFEKRRTHDEDLLRATGFDGSAFVSENNLCHGGRILCSRSMHGSSKHRDKRILQFRSGWNRSFQYLARRWNLTEGTSHKKYDSEPLKFRRPDFNGPGELV
jgi:hypothetical protein